MPVVYVLNVEEFLPIIDCAKALNDCEIIESDQGYFRIEAPTEIVLDRKMMGLKPAVWYGIFTGGMDGEIAEWGRDRVRIIGTNKPL